MGYKGVECQSLERDEDVISEQPIFPCLSWSIENRCCKVKYNIKISPKHPLIEFDINNFDKDCCGLSNPSRCVAFRGIELSKRELEFYNQKQEEKHDEKIKVIEKEKLI